MLVRPAALLDRIIVDNKTHYSLIELGDRVILQGICEMIAGSNTPGAYYPDSELDGDSPLASRVALWCGVYDVEAVACAMERLCHRRVLSITASGRILLPNIVRGRAHPSAVNGRLSIGRRRKGETAKRYAARAKKNRSALKRVDLEAEAATGLQMLNADTVTGETLARVLRELRPTRTEDQAGVATDDGGPKADAHPSFSTCAENTEVGGAAASVGSVPPPQDEVRHEGEPTKATETSSISAFPKGELGGALESLQRAIKDEVQTPEDKSMSNSPTQKPDSPVRKVATAQIRMSPLMTSTHLSQFRTLLEEFVKPKRRKTCVEY